MTGLAIDLTAAVRTLPAGVHKLAFEVVRDSDTGHVVYVGLFDNDWNLIGQVGKRPEVVR